MNMPDHQTALPCPCGKDKTYEQCCYRFINGQSRPKTPEQLMRSRYTAYALGGLGEYLLRTWFPITARGLTVEQLSEKNRRWIKLDVLNRSQDGDEGVVEFKAYYAETESDNEKTEVMHEVSEFRRIAGKWLYVGGRVK
jgi:SEC-C motif-containing protein